MSEWFSVDERLPEEIGDYLVFFSYYDPSELNWSHVDISAFEKGQFTDSESGAKITHWMPLPDTPAWPPKQKDAK